MTAHDFIARFGSVYEHSPWVAECAATAVDEAADLSAIATAMAACVDHAGTDRQLELIRAHPDLAGKARLAGKLTAASTAEQKSAGLDCCSAEELERFRSLNERYREKFGFPFVMAVRDATRAEILDAFERRLGNDYDTEFSCALIEIHRIARLRLDAMEPDE